MHIIAGPFHPHLEEALVEEILKFKKSDLLCALLIVVPSEALRRRLKVLLARERKLSLLNLHVLTFYQLSAKLFAEANATDAPAPRDDLLLEEALRCIIETRQPGSLPFAEIEERAGGGAALWQSLRDLRDGMVPPEIALEALEEGHFGASTRERTGHLLVLLKTLLNICEACGIEGSFDLDKAAVACAPESHFLGRFAQIFYYGFYDLTQVQIDLFHTVARHFATTLLFPLLKAQPAHDGWLFAERFYGRYLQGRGGGGDTRHLIDLTEPATRLPASLGIFDREARREYRAMPSGWRCRIFNTSGMRDEISAVAKEILRLTDEQGAALDEIGVVARNLEGYGAIIKEIFSRHRIATRGSVDEPLIQFPLTQAAMLLLNLPAKDYPRSDVIDLIASPYFRAPLGTGEPFEPRPDLWDLASRELAICKGIKEWQRLERYASRGMKLGQISDDDERRFIEIPASQVKALASVVTGLHEALGRLPKEASWSRYARYWKDLLARYLGIESPAACEPADADSAVRERIVGLLDQMAVLDAVQPTVSLGRFGGTFQRWLERTAVNGLGRSTRGVQISNAGAARGLRFRTLFIVGMNEGVFPRTIREDAFLRDYDREIFERDLGYKVSQKLAGFDEEKLLFTLLVNSAQERLYCSFLRSDDDGRVLAPSWYLAELKRSLAGANPQQITEHTIPRSIVDKADCAPFDCEERLPPEELALRLSLAGTNAQALIEATAPAPELYKRGLAAVQKLDRSSNRLGAADGIIEPPAKHWLRLSERGVSPTSLELYARCPFQYFARHMLGLQRLERPEDIEGPGAAEVGELGHAILKLTYQELMRRGYFSGKARESDIDAIIAEAAQEAFNEYETKNPIGYPLLWETLRETLSELIGAVIVRDLQELDRSGFTPAELEADIAERLPADWPEPLGGVRVHGRLDRIDTDPVQNRMRVVDYKFKLGAQPSAADNDLVRSALRGQRLQPPLYSLLVKAKGTRADPAGMQAQIEASLYYIAPRWNDGPLSIRSFGARDLSGPTGAEIQATLAQLARGIRGGHFFIQPGEACAHCEVAEVCRKNHPPSLWRAENDPITTPHRRLRRKDLKKP